MQKKILVTGATGFLGRFLVEHFCSSPDTIVVAPLRNIDVKLPDNVTVTHIPDINNNTDWRKSLSGVHVVVHAAARVHVMDEEPLQSIEKFRKINVQGTLRLAREAAEAGVKRFIYISSIKVNGESTSINDAFTAYDTPHPSDAYGISKCEAEQQLMQLAQTGAIEVVVIRPVLIYGPGVGANFHQMLQWLIKGIPLPFGSVNNSRSLVFVKNVVDLVSTCIDHPRAANEVFLVSDDEDVSTTQLMRRLLNSLGTKTRLIPVPVKMLTLLADLVGRGTVAQRLLGSLKVDIQKNRRLLGWRPPYTLNDGLQVTAAHFLESRKK
ncbi:MAG TPA: SDR family oxidoreductase [Pseudomonas sp.]|uniref:UDP-glucose 4-epimerase family protein n=1 Tax=Pseudomonas sp. TaxID=306 RepID=UPI002B9013C9|nr:SDR family oxidoreductase [Pseudomonas sp.]HWH88318.1 SDR family oxidoreductase [Pseudomonas sp.]